MATFCFLPSNKITPWLDILSENQDVYVPKREATSVLYRLHEKGIQPVLGIRPTESAKHVVFPRAHELFTFSYSPHSEELGNRELTLKEPEDPKQTILFGAPSCDARGFFTFDPVYDGCGTKGMAKDVYYVKRREATTIVVFSCATVLSTCFCNWSGGNPTSKEGADVHATLLSDGLVLEALTEKGQALVDGAKTAGATSVSKEQETALAEQHKQAEQSVNPVPSAEPLSPEVLAQSILARFDDKEFWLAESAACLSCGACTYLCPTCYCFNITDESNGINGVRLRSWDTCMASLFTLEASGHNPRQGKADRLRNRIGHKLSYYPTIHEGRLACCGCGRCIKSCPSSIDIRRIMHHALAMSFGADNEAGTKEPTHV